MNREMRDPKKSGAIMTLGDRRREHPVRSGVGSKWNGPVLRCKSLHATHQAKASSGESRPGNPASRNEQRCRTAWVAPLWPLPRSLARLARGAISHAGGAFSPDEQERLEHRGCPNTRTGNDEGGGRISCRRLRDGTSRESAARQSEPEVGPEHDGVGCPPRTSVPRHRPASPPFGQGAPDRLGRVSLSHHVGPDLPSAHCRRSPTTLGTIAYRLHADHHRHSPLTGHPPTGRP